MMNEQRIPTADELEQLRLRVIQLEQALEQQRQHDAQQQANQRQAPPELGRVRRAMNFMYNVGNQHAIVRNFGWAVADAVRAAGYIGGCLAAAAKATPAMLLQAKAAYAAALALAAANPVGATVAGVATLAAAEKATRYTDEEGNTRHQCSIM